MVVIMNANQKYVALYHEQTQEGATYDPAVTQKVFDVLDTSPYLGKAELLGVYSEFAVSRLRDTGANPEHMKALVSGLVERFDRERAAGYNQDARFDMFELSLCLNAGFLDPAYFNKVLTLTEEALPLSPDRPQFYSLRGRAYMGLGRNDEGLADFKRAVELAPNIPEAHMNLFRAYLIIGDHVKAQKELQALSTISPFDTQMLARISGVYIAAGLYDDAAKLLQEAIAQLPDSAVEIYIGLAQVYAAAGDAKQAREAMQQAVTLDNSASSYAEDFYRRLDAGELTKKK
jgi:tetratricopeptide (TPR) repeat protein